MKPVIGITCDFDWSNNRAQLFSGYYEAVLRCGGLPFILPCTEKPDIPAYLSMIDGLMLTGGQDPDPYLFDEEPHPKISSVNPQRDSIEMPLCIEAAKSNLPVLGICRGMQIMNIAMGGDIYQDISSQHVGETKVCHIQNAPKWYGSHRVFIQRGSLLEDMVKGDTIRVNSFHHQAVRNLGSDLVAVGWTKDGIIEAIESAGLDFFVGVQWHPEQMWQKDSKVLGLFQTFVDSCKK